ncbi:hypothetical protein SB783_43535, partial [Paraburkholderia sp. SIMBA_009]
AGLVPSRRTKRHQGAAGIRDTSASLRLIRNRLESKDVTNPALAGFFHLGRRFLMADRQGGLV